MENDNLLLAGILDGFFSAIRSDQRIRPTHIGLYATLLHYWQAHDRPDCLSAHPEEMMRLAKISAISTYLRYLRELDEFGYIRYYPSYSPRKGSRVRLVLPPVRHRAGMLPRDAGENNAP